MEKIICIVVLVLYGLVMLAMCYIAIFPKEKKPKNNVHFYVARDKCGKLYLHIGKPFRDKLEFSNNLHMYYLLCGNNFKYFGLNENDYTNLRWEDEPVEVFINMED